MEAEPQDPDNSALSAGSHCRWRLGHLLVRQVHAALGNLTIGPIPARHTVDKGARCGQGEPNKPRFSPIFYLADLMTGYFAAAGMIAALLHQSCRDQFPMIPQEGESTFGSLRIPPPIVPTCLSYASAIALRLWMPTPYYPVEITILARDSHQMIYTNPI